jgi:hypothetical protein
MRREKWIRNDALRLQLEVEGYSDIAQKLLIQCAFIMSCASVSTLRQVWEFPNKQYSPATNPKRAEEEIKLFGDCDPKTIRRC